MQKIGTLTQKYNTLEEWPEVQKIFEFFQIWRDFKKNHSFKIIFQTNFQHQERLERKCMALGTF